MSSQSLEALLQTAGNPVTLVRNSQIGPYVYPKVPSEFSNWRDEQQAWRETCCLFDQSHHMTDLYIKGPDALKLLTGLGVNSFASFAVNKAKQFVACNYDGYVIGDAILFYLTRIASISSGARRRTIGCSIMAKRATTTRSVDRDELVPPPTPTGNRPQHGQGPKALKALEKVNGGPLPEIKFFNMGEITIAGRKVRALAPRHVRCAGPRGLRPVRRRRRGQGRDHRGRQGVRPRAGRAEGHRHEHARVGLDPVPVARDFHRGRPEGLPRVAPGERLRGHRLARRQLHYSDDISDYYLTLLSSGYGRSSSSTTTSPVARRWRSWATRSGGR